MNPEQTMNIASMQPQCTPEEWQARIDLAACYRLVDLYRMSDMMANHISAHVPGEHGAGEILAKPDFGDLAARSNAGAT